MLGTRSRLVLAVLVLAVLCPAALAAEDIPLRNWSVPQGGSGLSTLADIGAPGIFVAMSPCRLMDTRGNGFVGAYGPPILTAAGRTVNIVASTCTGIPASVVAFSLNFTVTGAVGAGFITAYPAGGSMPTVSTLNYNAGDTIANAAVVPAGSGTSITVLAGVSNTHLIIDINGYYIGGGSDLNSGERLWISGTYNGGGIIRADNNSTSTGYGIYAETWGTSSSAAGVVAWAQASTGAVNGLRAYASSSTANSSGVYGSQGGAGQVYGVRGEFTSTSATDGAAGVYGLGAAVTAAGVQTSGVLGESATSVNDSGAVLGRNTSAALPAHTNIFARAGVRGEGTNIGVVGVTGTAGWGTVGGSLTSGGGLGPWGYIGNATNAAYFFGNMGASGTKSFVEPHPYKAGTVIRYVALEGPEAGTYFRGRGTLVGGRAVIEVPETFRLVTDEEGITVQITPIGRATAVGVTRIALDFIEVEGVKDVEFSYLVQGVRKTFKDFQVEIESDDYMPMFPDSKIPSYFSEAQKRNLIQAGVYNEDGTVNMNTARRLGWDKAWEKGIRTRQ